MIMTIKRGQSRDESLLRRNGFGRRTEREMLFMGARKETGMAKMSH